MRRRARRGERVLRRLLKVCNGSEKSILFKNSFVRSFVRLPEREQKNLVQAVRKLLTREGDEYAHSLNIKTLERPTARSPSGCSVASSSKAYRFTFLMDGNSVRFLEAGHHTQVWKSEK